MSIEQDWEDLAFVQGFLAAKKRDVVTVDPYKVEGEGSR